MIFSILSVIFANYRMQVDPKVHPIPAMRRWKSSFFFFIATVGFCWILFTSLSPQQYSYSVTGQVEALTGSYTNAKIRYTQDKENTDFGNMKALDVRANGTFSAVINVEAQGKVYFYITKDNYTTVQYEHVLTDQNRPNNLGTFKFSSLHKDLSYKQLSDPEAGPFVYLHHDQDLTHLDDKVNVSDILYFTDIQKVAAFPTENTPDKITLAAKVNRSGRKGRKKTYFSLEIHESGEAYIADGTSAPTPTTARQTKLASRSKE